MPSPPSNPAVPPGAHSTHLSSSAAWAAFSWSVSTTTTQFAGGDVTTEQARGERRMTCQVKTNNKAARAKRSRVTTQFPSISVNEVKGGRGVGKGSQNNPMNLVTQIFHARTKRTLSDVSVLNRLLSGLPGLSRVEGKIYRYTDAVPTTYCTFRSLQRASALPHRQAGAALLLLLVQLGPERKQSRGHPKKVAGAVAPKTGEPRAP